MNLKLMRRNLLLGSAFVVSGAGAAGYGRAAYAACVASPSPTYICSGTEFTTQSILNVTEATVSTEPGFFIDTSGTSSEAIVITGDGDISFTDSYRSSITGDTDGLSITGLDTPGSGGSVTVNVTGDVKGNTNAGIMATNGAGGTSIMVTTGPDSMAYGGTSGIFAENHGSGFLKVEANGDVYGINSYGIHAVTSGISNTADTVVTGGAYSVIGGGKDGIFASTAGLGALSVVTRHYVTGYARYGINASITNTGNTKTLQVTVGEKSNVFGKEKGINAVNKGKGVLSIEADGVVTGQFGDGIFASADNSLNTGGITITTGANSSVNGATHGVSAVNSGSGDTTIEVNGDVSGGEAAIKAFAIDYHSTISITVGGLAYNSSGLASDLAIETTGAATVLDNTGTTIGTVRLSAFGDTFTNTSTWTTSGDSDFDAGEDEVANGGLINAGGGANVAGITRLLNLETLRNGGTISLADQLGGDGSNVSDSLVIEGDYVGEGGTLAVDAFLGGAGSAADVLTIVGDSSGTTLVSVTDTNPQGAAIGPDGILVVDVKGISNATNFALAGGPIERGLYAYDLFYKDSGANGQFLLGSFPGVGAFESAAIVSGAQNIFFDTTQSWVEHQDGLRDWYGSRNVVVAVSDPPAEEQANHMGLWLTIRGTLTDREADAQTQAFGTSYSFDTGYAQNTYSLMGGADFGATMAGGTLLFGALAGYFTSDQELNGSSTSISYQGGSLGAYATYLKGGFFADLLGKLDMFAIDYDAENNGGDDTNGLNWGLRSDVGYRFAAGGAYVEPVASLAAVWTNIDDFSLYGSTAKPGDNDAVQLGGGARIGWEMSAIDLSLTGRAWDAVSGGNDIGLIVPGTTLTSVSDSSFTGLFGEVSGAFRFKFAPWGNVSLAGSYLFNDEQTALSGAAGFSFIW